MKSLMKKLERLLELGGIKKDVTFLVISGVAVICSLLKLDPLPFDMAWIAIILCGIPIVLEAVVGLVTAFDIKADVLVSLALIASVIWNFTLNRKFTFKSANNVPKAMAMVLGYYAVFTPLSTIHGNWLAESCGWNEYLVTILNMLLNFVTEYLFDTFVVFRGSMDTNDLAKKEEQK